MNLGGFIWFSILSFTLLFFPFSKCSIVIFESFFQFFFADAFGDCNEHCAALGIFFPERCQFSVTAAILCFGVFCILFFNYFRVFRHFLGQFVMKQFVVFFFSQWGFPITIRHFNYHGAPSLKHCCFFSPDHFHRFHCIFLADHPCRFLFLQ